jgi:HK97 family phage major capsid protein
LQTRSLPGHADNSVQHKRKKKMEKNQKAVLLSRAADLISKKDFNRQDRALVESYIQLANALGDARESRTEEVRAKQAEHLEEFRTYLATGLLEKRTYAPLDTVGIGGFLLPMEFQEELFRGVGLIEPLFDESNVRFIRTQTGRSLKAPGIDLSAMTASIIAQNTDNPPATNPVFSSKTFGAFTYKTSPVGLSFELSQDSFDDVSEIITEAFEVGFANGIGQDLISGNGVSAPQGLLTAATDSGVVTASNTAITANEIASIYFKLPRIHRLNPMTAWVVSDGVYQLLRKAQDSSGRPLLSYEDGTESLMGRKVLVSPSMASGSSAKFAFANLSQYVVRVATDSVRVQVANQLPGYAEQGTSLLYSFMRVDAKLIAPAASVTPAVFATLHV